MSQVFTGGSISFGSASSESETPEALRKRLKAAEKKQKATRKAVKAHAEADAKRDREIEAARAALVAVAADETKGYARVWAARSILGLEGCE